MKHLITALCFVPILSLLVYLLRVSHDFRENFIVLVVVCFLFWVTTYGIMRLLT